MSGPRSFLALLALPLLVACGGSAVESPDGGSAGAASDGGSGGTAADGGSGSGSGGGDGGGLSSGGSTYIDPPCPVTAKPDPELHCDPVNPYDGCPAGTGCYGALIYPSDPCGYPRYVADCIDAGVGGQGALCSSFGECSPGFMCVVGAAGGARCARMCELGPGAVETCDDGLICGATDFAGYGVCY